MLTCNMSPEYMFAIYHQRKHQITCANQQQLMLLPLLQQQQQQHRTSGRKSFDIMPSSASKAPSRTQKSDFQDMSMNTAW